jgi:GntR family transcriptional regulator, carbon starvation induced regulator
MNLAPRPHTINDLAEHRLSCNPSGLLPAKDTMSYDRSPPDGPALAKPTRVSRIAAELGDAIVAGRLAPGSKLNLDQLRAEIGVSLSPLREAVSRLVAEGLVVVEDQRGYSVAPVSRADLEEVALLSAEFEAMALGHAMARAALNWESGILAALHRARKAGGGALAHYDALHAGLAEGSGMPLLVQSCERMRRLLLRYRTLAGYDGAERPLAAEYAMIAEAAVARNAELAPVLLRQQVRRTGAAIAARLGHFGADHGA